MLKNITEKDPSYIYKGFFNKSATKVFLNKTNTVLNINIPVKVRSMPL